MHARLLLPGLFGLLLPLAVVPLRRGWTSGFAVLVAIVATWALVTALDLRTDYYGTANFHPNGTGIADERGFYTALSGKAHPVTLEDYRHSAPYGLAGRLREDLEAGRSYVIVDLFDPKAAATLRPREDLAQDIVIRVGNIGIFGYMVGPDVWVADALGLGDPFGSRTALLPDRPGRIGHEKSLHPAWVIARLTEGRLRNDPEVTAARRALECGEVARLESAVRDPLTVGRFVINVFDSPRLTALRLDFLPTRVAEEHCP